MRATFKALVVLITLGAVISGAALFVLTRAGVSTRNAPTATEVMLARFLRHVAVPSAQRGMRNPIALTPTAMTDARHHFADHCAQCHGNDGSGKTEMGQMLYPKAPDMRLQRTQRLSDGELYAIISNGVRLTGMPAWGDGSKEASDSTWALVHFIRHMPAMTPAEVDEMKLFNPMSRAEMEEKAAEDEFLKGNDTPTDTKSGNAGVSPDHAVHGRKP